MEEKFKKSKNLAKQFLLSKEYNRAFNEYSKLYNQLKELKETPPDSTNSSPKTLIKRELAILATNCGICKAGNNESKKADFWFQEAIENDRSYKKAVFRKAQNLEIMGYDEDALKLLKNENEDKEFLKDFQVQKLLQKLREKILKNQNFEIEPTNVLEDMMYLDDQNSIEKQETIEGDKKTIKLVFKNQDFLKKIFLKILKSLSSVDYKMAWNYEQLCILHENLFSRSFGEWEGLMNEENFKIFLSIFLKIFEKIDFWIKHNIGNIKQYLDLNNNIQLSLWSIVVEKAENFEEKIFEILENSTFFLSNLNNLLILFQTHIGGDYNVLMNKKQPTIEKIVKIYFQNLQKIENSENLKNVNIAYFETFSEHVYNLAIIVCKTMSIDTSRAFLTAIFHNFSKILKEFFSKKMTTLALKNIDSENAELILQCLIVCNHPHNLEYMLKEPHKLEVSILKIFNFQKIFLKIFEKNISEILGSENFDNQNQQRLLNCISFLVSCLSNKEFIKTLQSQDSELAKKTQNFLENCFKKAEFLNPQLLAKLSLSTVIIVFELFPVHLL